MLYFRLISVIVSFVSAAFGSGILARKQGERVQAWSRRGDRFPAIAQTVRGLACDRALIGGIAVVLREDGWSEFGALRDVEVRLLLNKGRPARPLLWPRARFEFVSVGGANQRRGSR